MSDLLLQDVLDYLKKTTPPFEIKAVEIGFGKSKKKGFLVNNQLQYVSSIDQIQRPESEEKLLEDLIKRLNLKKTDLVNCRSTEDPYGTVILEAIRAQHFHLVKVLLDHGADPSKCDKDGNNGFMLAARKGYTEILNELLTVVQAEDKAIKPSKAKVNNNASEPTRTKAVYPSIEGQSDAEKTDTAPEPHSRAAQTQDRSLPIEGQPATTKRKAYTPRVKLKGGVLHMQNRWGETAEKLIEKFIKERDQKEAEAKKRILEEKNNNNDAKDARLDLPMENRKSLSVEELKKLVNKAHALSKDPKNKKSDPSTAFRVVSQNLSAEISSTKTEADYVRAREKEIQDQRYYAEHLYDGFYKNKLSFFSHQNPGPNSDERRKAQLRSEVRKLRAEHCGLFVATLATIQPESLPTPAAYVRVHGENIDELHYFNVPNKVHTVIEMKSEELRSFDSTMGLEEYLRTAEKFTQMKRAEYRIKLWDVSPDHREEYQARSAAAAEEVGLNIPVLISVSDKLPLSANDQLKIRQLTGHSPLNPAEAQYQFRLDRRGNNTLVPSFTNDKNKVRAALSLIKDYYAPENAPLPHFLQHPKLRRFLTFHWARRYTERAEDLFNQLGTIDTHNADGILEVYTAIRAEYFSLLKADHDKNNKNNVGNSSYTRRLYYAMKALEKTQVYRYSQDPDQEHYLNVLDRVEFRV